MTVVDDHDHDDADERACAMMEDYWERPRETKELDWNREPDGDGEPDWEREPDCPRDCPPEPSEPDYPDFDSPY